MFIRKDPHHEIKALSGKPLLLFVTLGVRDVKHPWRASDIPHGLLCDIWRLASGWKVHRYVLMPDHLHFFAFPGSMDVSFKRWMAYWKSLWAKHAHDTSWRFQTDYWDVTIRSAQHYEEKAWYMMQNPIVRGLSSLAEDWPFQGIIHDFIWLEHR